MLSIRVAKEQPIALRAAVALVAGMRFPHPPFGKWCTPDHGESRIRLGHLGHKRTGAIFGAVVHHNDLEARIVLVEEGAHAGRNLIRLVSGGNDDRHQRSILEWAAIRLGDGGKTTVSLPRPPVPDDQPEDEHGDDV